MSSNANTERRRPIAEDADIRLNKRRKTGKVSKPENAMKIEREIRSEKAMKPSNKPSANVLLTPVSMKATEVVKGNGNSGKYHKQAADSHYDHPTTIQPSYASSMMSIGRASHDEDRSKSYAVTTLERSNRHPPKGLYESYYVDAPTEPNSIAEWIDPDGRVPTYREFVAAIKRKCVGMSDRDRSKEREQRRKREWARVDVSPSTSLQRSLKYGNDLALRKDELAMLNEI